MPHFLRCLIGLHAWRKNEVWQPHRVIDEYCWWCRKRRAAR